MFSGFAAIELIAENALKTADFDAPYIQESLTMGICAA
jgi:hypothetical protein